MTPEEILNRFALLPEKRRDELGGFFFVDLVDAVAVAPASVAAEMFDRISAEIRAHEATELYNAGKLTQADFWKRTAAAREDPRQMRLDWDPSGAWLSVVKEMRRWRR